MEPAIDWTSRMGTTYQFVVFASSRFSHAKRLWQGQNEATATSLGGRYPWAMAVQAPMTTAGLITTASASIAHNFNTLSFSSSCYTEHTLGQALTVCGVLSARSSSRSRPQQVIPQLMYVHFLDEPVDAFASALGSVAARRARS